MKRYNGNLLEKAIYVSVPLQQFAYVLLQDMQTMIKLSLKYLFSAIIIRIV